MRKEDFETYAARGGSLGTVVFEGTREELTPSVFVRARSIACDLGFLERHRIKGTCWKEPFWNPWGARADRKERKLACHTEP